MDVKIKDAWYDFNNHSVYTAIIDVPSLELYDIPYTISENDVLDTDLYRTVKQLLCKYNIRSCKIEKEELESEIRDKRNSILNATDRLLTIPDIPISESEKEEARQYRQALRDITKQEGFPENVIWPDQPECVKKYI